MVRWRGADLRDRIAAKFNIHLHALLWHFMSYRDGLCFPSYETIAEKARCCRNTVYEAILAFEDTGVFTWINRIDRVAERVKDRFGHWTNTYRIARRSNVYQFRDPLPCAEALTSLRKSSKSENPTGQEIQDLSSRPTPYEAGPNSRNAADPHPLNWSTLRYVFGHEKEDRKAEKAPQA